MAVEPGLEIIAYFVQPCPDCGAACGGTVRIWYLHGQRKLAFETDRASLRRCLEAVVDEAFAQGGYDALPAWIRHWNEGSDWAALASPATQVDPRDLLDSVAWMQRHATSDEHASRMLAALAEFVEAALHTGREIWTCET